MKLTNTTAEMMLQQCRGDEIWSRDTCRKLGVPDPWIDELTDCFESGFDSDQNTIYHQNDMVNQFEGVPDLLLAYKLAEFLGIDWKRATAMTTGKRAQVQAIQAELDEI